LRDQMKIASVEDPFLRGTIVGKQVG
jgi:hypothetical protein